MIRFTVETDGFVALDRAFNRIEQQISDFRSIWPNVTKVVYGIFGKAFDTEGASTAGGKWKALTPKYAKWKAAHYPGQPILRATNALFESLTDPEAAGAIYRPERDELIIGTKDPKGRGHQRGAGHLPVRQIMAFTERDKRDIQKSIQVGLVEFARNLGFKAEEKAA